MKSDVKVGVMVRAALIVGAVAIAAALRRVARARDLLATITGFIFILFSRAMCDLG
jgi:hypothetical protein